MSNYTNKVEKIENNIKEKVHAFLSNCESNEVSPFEVVSKKDREKLKDFVKSAFYETENDEDYLSVLRQKEEAFARKFFISALER